jgi:hypothetical protein
VLLSSEALEERMKMEVDRFISLNQVRLTYSRVIVFRINPLQDRWQLCPRGSSLCRMVYSVAPPDRQVLLRSFPWRTGLLIQVVIDSGAKGYAPPAPMNFALAVEGVRVLL